MITGCFLNWQALSCEHGFIYSRVAFQDPSINGDLLSRSNDYNITRYNLFYRDILFSSIPDDPCGLCLQAHQLFDGFGGPSLCNSFEIFSEQYQRDDHSTRLKIQFFHHTLMRGEERIVNAVEIGS